VTTTGNCTPATDPTDWIVGFEVIVTISSVFVPFGPFWMTQVAFPAEPEMMSATVLMLPPVHAAGPPCVTGPQSMSVTRRIELPLTDICLLKSIAILSPWSRLFAKAPDDMSVAAVEVGVVPPAAFSVYGTSMYDCQVPVPPLRASASTV